MQLAHRFLFYLFFFSNLISNLFQGGISSRNRTDQFSQNKVAIPLQKNSKEGTDKLGEKKP